VDNRQPPKLAMLDRNGAEIEVHGDQEGAASNGELPS
jgi:hypothetical protein